MQDEIEKKWRLLDPLIDEIEMSRRMDVGRQYSYDYSLMKLYKVKKLKENIDNDEFELKREYLMLMHERNVYLEKLLMIRQLCEYSKSAEDQDLVQLIRPLIEYFMMRLRKDVQG